jgi:hypothetical protein
VLLAFLMVASAACSRSDDGSSTPTDQATTTSVAGSGDPTALANGGFGDLEKVCQPGDASGATHTGVTDTEIHVGTLTDKGFVGSAGLNEEMYDAAVAFTKWCNEHGGILGRQLVLDDLDAALTEYEPRMTEACSSDFAVVGGGAVFDEDPNNVRVGCDMPNIAGYVVSARARSADLQVQPVPNPLEKTSLGRLLAAKRDFPDGISSFGIMASGIPSVQLVRDQIVQAAKSVGFQVAYSIEYAPSGETGWANFVADMKAKGIKILEYVGQPADFVALNQAMDTAGWAPDVILLSTNFYDAKYAQEAKGIAPNLYIQSQFHPFEEASDYKATSDFLDLMAQYNPSGKVAQLGAQGLSAWLLFAQAATECGSELTSACLLEKAAAATGWTGGGLHSPQTPGNTEPSSCYLILTLGADGFSVNEAATAPTDGPFNCDPANVFDVSGA